MQVDMVAGFSILSFHDCAEMFLLLVAENKGMKGEKCIYGLLEQNSRINT